MKKTFLALSLMAASVFGALNIANAQIKEGSITYSMTIEGLPPEQAAMMEGMEMKTIFKNNKSRSEVNSAFMNSVTVTDGKGGFVTLMDGMGQKSYIKGNTEDAKKKSKSSEKEPKITYTDDKKTIAGYDCKKAIIEAETENKEVSKVNVWYTDKIAPVEGGMGGRGGQFKGLKGVPLEFDMPQGPMNIKVSATKISTESVSDDLFNVSTEGYTEMDPDAMRGMGGQ
jgi:GLPGLI family protein